MTTSSFARLFKRWRHMALGLLGRVLLTLIGLTLRYKIEGAKQFCAFAASDKCILMFWHNRLAMMAEILSRVAPHFTYAALISDSRDGEYIAMLVKSYKQGRTLRVPHNSRAKALQLLIQEIKSTKDIFIITPDGPRGPLYKVKPGIALAARAGNAKIVPVSWHASRYWSLPTWDQLMLPKPFSTITVYFGNPLSVSESKEAETSLEAKKLEDALLKLTRK